MQTANSALRLEEDLGPSRPSTQNYEAIEPYGQMMFRGRHQEYDVAVWFSFLLKYIITMTDVVVVLHMRPIANSVMIIACFVYSYVYTMIATICAHE